MLLLPGRLSPDRGYSLTMSQGYFLRSGSQYRQGLAYIAVVDLLDVIDPGRLCSRHCNPMALPGWLGQDLLPVQMSLPDICAFTVAEASGRCVCHRSSNPVSSRRGLRLSDNRPDQFTDRAFVQV